MAKEKKCKICSCEPSFYDEDYSLYHSTITLVSGGWTELMAGKDKDNRVIMCGQGDGNTDFYYPKYCPECGRKLQ